MEPSVLAPWRDAAIVLLVIEVFAILLVPGIALYFAVRGVRAFKRWLRNPLLQAQVWALRLQHGTTRTADAIARVPITIESNVTKTGVTVRGVVDYIVGR